MPTTFAIDADGWFRPVDMPEGIEPQRMTLEPGWRFASLPEIDAERALRSSRQADEATRRAHDADVMHGARAHIEPAPAGVYVLAARIGMARPFAIRRADLDALASAATGRPTRVKAAQVEPIHPVGLCLPRRGTVAVEGKLGDMLATIAGRADLGAAAFIAWHLTWLHPYEDGNGRASRAAAYAVLLAADGGLREAHHRRGIGRETLTVPERIERSRGEYIAALNEIHAAVANGHTPNLARLERYLDRLAADQIASRASHEDPPTPQPRMPVVFRDRR